MLTASHASREGYRTPDLDGTDGRTYTLARKGETSPLLPSASAVGDIMKVYSIFSKIAAEPPRRVAVATAKLPPPSAECGTPQTPWFRRT